MFVFNATAQKTAPAARPMIKSVTTKAEAVPFGVGGTVTIQGAPEGSISIQGWNKSELQVTAEIELQAESEADLAQLAKVNGFTFDESFGHIRILTVGTHDKEYMKLKAKKFPKKLLGLPWKVNYTIQVPAISDLNITAGKGDLKLSGVEGAMQIKAAETNAELSLSGGAINAVFGAGQVNVKLAAKSWRGRHLQVQLATGNLNLEMPASMNADISASVLKTGQIQSSYAALKPLDRKKFNDKIIVARAGGGGAPLGFTVGDGEIRISQLTEGKKP